jgi:hypothetical protein
MKVPKGRVGLAIASTGEAATGSWSPRSSPQAAHLWTRAGLIRTSKATSEIASAKQRRTATPPVATAARMSLASRLTVDQQQDRRAPSSARDVGAGSSTAHLRTSSAPDRRARSAHLAALAGIFHEAHAPPQPNSTGLIS